MKRHIILDEDLMIHVPNNLPIEQPEKDIKDTVRPLTVSKINKELRNKFGKIYKFKGYRAEKKKKLGVRHLQ